MRATSVSTARIQEDVAAQRQALSKLPEILQQMEDLNAARLPQAPPHGAVDRASIKIDYGFALRRHTDDAASICPDLNTPSAPSLQVSAFESSNGQLTSRFYTAPESQGSNCIDRQTSRKCTQILVRSVGLHKTIALQVIPDHTIDTVKSLVRERIGLDIAEFELLYSSRVLDLSDRSIADYGIPHDATLTCISFRLNQRLNQPPPPITPQEIYLTDHTDNTDKTYQLSVTSHTKVCELKEMHVNQQGGDLEVAGISLIFRGQILENDCRLYEKGIGPGSRVHRVLRWRLEVSRARRESSRVRWKILQAHTSTLSAVAAAGDQMSSNETESDTITGVENFWVKDLEAHLLLDFTPYAEKCISGYV